jgi:hypothetical protein
MSKPTLTLSLKVSPPKPKITLKKPKITSKPKITLKKPKITPKSQIIPKDQRQDVLGEFDDEYVDEDYEYEYDPEIDEEFLMSDLEYLRQIPHQEAGPPDPYKIDAFLPSKYELDEVMKLNQTQQKALKYIVDQSKVLSEKAQTELEERLKKMGYGQGDILRLRLYIRDEAPIIIHLKPQIIELLYNQKETHYRNKFDVLSKMIKYNSSAGLGCRKKWEDRMFNEIYKKSKPHERVKYGVLNILNDPYGVRECYGYGDCYLQLKGVRLRTTFADQDTAVNVSKIASCEYYGHVLEKYNDKELKSIMQVALGHQTFKKQRGIITSYKEVQIHGDVNLREHVELMVVNPKYRSKKSQFPSVFEKFSAYYNLPMIWMDKYV